MAKKEENLAKEKETKLVPVNVKYPEKLLEKIDEYQIEHHLNSRSSAILELVRKGLGEW